MPDVNMIRAEWHKLRSVPRWMIGVLGAGVITVVFSLLIASSSGTNVEGSPVITDSSGNPVVDDLHFVHQPMAGDGTVTVELTSQTGLDQSGNATDPQPSAKAGVMIKESTEAGSDYVAVLATPADGIGLQSNFMTDIAGSESGSPRWMRLVRDGATITGFESGDGRTWDEIGSVRLDNLPETVEAGFFVASPPELTVERRSGSSSVGLTSSLGRATFDNVQLESAGAQGEWASDEVGTQGFAPGPAEEVDGVFTVTGSGDIAFSPPEDDVVQLSLVGVLIGSLAVIATSVLFVTTEYRRGMVRTTFAASPRRGAVLAAKALVAGIATFVVAAAACLAAFLLAYPLLRSNGFAPPHFPEPSLADPTVLRAVLGSAAVLALVAVLGVAVGTIVRHSAAAIGVVTALFFLPAFLAQGLVTPALSDWLVGHTPAGGLAIQRALPPSDIVINSFSTVAPWAGLAVLCAYVVAALGVAGVLVRRRDV